MFSQVNIHTALTSFMWMNFLSLHFVEVYNLLILVVAKGYSGYAGKQLF